VHSFVDSRHAATEFIQHTIFSREAVTKIGKTYLSRLAALNQIRPEPIFGRMPYAVEVSSSLTVVWRPRLLQGCQWSESEKWTLERDDQRFRDCLYMNYDT